MNDRDYNLNLLTIIADWNVFRDEVQTHNGLLGAGVGDLLGQLDGDLLPGLGVGDPEDAIIWGSGADALLGVSGQDIR